VWAKNRSSSEGAGQDLPEWAGFTGDSGHSFRAQWQDGDESLGLRCAPAQASMKPSLSRPAAKNIFFLFLVKFDRHLGTTHLLGLGA
jgi:hypothetical protein